MTKKTSSDDPRLKRVCPKCGTEFTVECPSTRKTFCGYSCAAKSRGVGSGSNNPNWRGGKTKHPLYDVYMDMIGRCHRPTHLRFRRYGGRGIYVCQRWRDSFWNFVEDMRERPHERPERMTIDRIDNDGPYSPENCRWATYQEQSANCPQWNRQGQSNPSAKLTESDVRIIRDLFTEGVSGPAIARRFNVTTTSVYAIRKGQAWTHLVT